MLNIITRRKSSNGFFLVSLRYPNPDISSINTSSRGVVHCWVTINMYLLAYMHRFSGEGDCERRYWDSGHGWEPRSTSESWNVGPRGLFSVSLLLLRCFSCLLMFITINRFGLSHTIIGFICFTAMFSSVGECFFWYWLTLVVPDKVHGAIKRLYVCLCVCSVCIIHVALDMALYNLIFVLKAPLNTSEPILSSGVRYTWRLEPSLCSNWFSALSC